MNKKLGLALGSGADRGFAHIGIIKILEQENIPIHCLSGSSIGSIAAAYYALYGEISGLEKISTSITSLDLLNLIDLNNPNISVIKGEKIRQFLKEKIFGDKTFADLKYPLSIAATDIDSGSSYVFRDGPLLDAVIASSTIPGVLPPFSKDSLHLVDGGLSNAVPIDLVQNLGAEVVLGVDLYAYNSPPPSQYTSKEVLSSTYRIYLSKLSSLNSYSQDPSVLIIHPHTNEGPETITFSKIKPNIEAGETEATNNLHSIRQLLS